MDDIDKDKIEVEYVKIDKLIPYNKNPRKNQDAVDKVAASIKEFGFKVPIVADDKNVIVAGHTRALASLKLGLEEVPVVRSGNLTEEQKKAFRLADNKTGELAQWDFEALESELESIDMDMTAFGFEELEEEYDFDDFEAEEEQGGRRCPHCGELL